MAISKDCTAQWLLYKSTCMSTPRNRQPEVWIFELLNESIPSYLYMYFNVYSTIICFLQVLQLDKLDVSLLEPLIIEWWMQLDRYKQTFLELYACRLFIFAKLSSNRCHWNHPFLELWISLFSSVWYSKVSMLYEIYHKFGKTSFVGHTNVVIC